MTKKCNNLVVLAAGMSSRMKQQDTAVGLRNDDVQQANKRAKALISVGSHGEVLLDYVLYNAQKAGFKKVYVVTGTDTILFKEHYKK